MLTELTFVAILAVSNAIPMWIGNPYTSGVYLRNSQVPSIAFGFGSGFSSDIGGIRHSSSFGNSFQTGGGEAYGAGFGGSDGNAIARGVGYARIVPQQDFQQLRQPIPQNFQQFRQPIPQNFHQFRHQIPQGIQQAMATSFSTGGKSFGSALTQNFGNFGSAISSAQSIDGVGSAISAVQGDGRSQSAISAVNNLGRNGFGSTVATTSNDGHGYGTVISRADNLGGYQTAIASTQGRNNINDNAQTAAITQNFGGYKTSTAYNVQQNGGLGQNSIASAINGPGFQLAQTQSINN